MTRAPLAGRETAAARGTSERAAAARGFRPDVEGLRAVAVGLVLLYHAGLPFVPGGFVGVDVFFVISGFLITGLLSRELQQTGRLSIAGFYARRAKRLLPAAAVVLATTAALTFVLVTRIRWAEIGGDIVSAALYVVNWRLAARSVDYLSEDSVASPVQHFWSLAVEEQYYLVWPLLLVLVAWWARRRAQTLRHELWIGLAVIAVPSFVWSVYYTGKDPSVAFFVTTTRMWELAIGAAVALGAEYLRRLPAPPAAALGWGGVAAIVVSALAFSKHTSWPGYAALLPTLGAAAVIAAGFSAGQRGPVRALGTRPFVWVGGLSYSLYLWHWPLIAVATAAAGNLSPLAGLAIAAASVVPAWLTLHYVENPIRHSTTTFKVTANSLKLGAVLTVAGVVVGGSLIGGAAMASTASAGPVAGAAALGAQPSAYQAPKTASSITPDPLEATEDVPDAYDNGCQVKQDSATPVPCDYGDRKGRTTIAVVGDSKALQWITALDAIGKQHGWHVISDTKSACTFADADIPFQGRRYTTCTGWNRNVVAQLKKMKPSLVITSQNAAKAVPAGGGKATADAMVDGLVRRWQQLRDAGIPVVELPDNPNPPNELGPIYECVDEHRDDLRKCAFTRVEGESGGGGDAGRKAAAKAGVPVIDMDDYLCPGQTCPPVIGGALVYRQGSHITKTYVNSLSRQLDRRLAPIVADVQRR